MSEERDRSDGVVVITSASHAEGREFEPRSDLFYFLFSYNDRMRKVNRNMMVLRCTQEKMN